VKLVVDLVEEVVEVFFERCLMKMKDLLLCEVDPDELMIE